MESSRFKGICLALLIIGTLGSKHYCGRSLSNVLYIVCQGFYNTLPPTITNTEEKLTTKAPTLLSKREAQISIFNKGFRRNKRGVFDECCKKSCSIDEIRSYCG